MSVQENEKKMIFSDFFSAAGNNEKKIFIMKKKRKKKVVQKLEICYCPICIVRVGLYRDMALEREGIVLQDLGCIVT